jgi:preprotein translocase subunit SecE
MIKKINQFFKSSKVELKKVEWPTKQELIRYTEVVIVASLAIGVYIFVLDSFLTEGLKVLIGN